jgi:HEAT repeat protein
MAFLQRRTGLLPLLPRLGPDAVHAFLEELAVRPEHAASEENLQRGAALALRRVGQPAVHFLLDLLQAPEQDSWRIVLDALVELGPLAGEAVPVLLRLLEDSRDAVRRAAIATLGRIGRPARAAIPALRQILNQWGEKELQILAMEALGGITHRSKENV